MCETAWMSKHIDAMHSLDELQFTWPERRRFRFLDDHSEKLMPQDECLCAEQLAGKQQENDAFFPTSFFESIRKNILH